MSKSGLFIFGGMGAATTGLGIWQLTRYYWKIDLLEKREVELESPISTMSDIYGSNNPNIYEAFAGFKGKRVQLSGTLDHSKELYLGLRSAPQLLEGAHAQGMATNPQGYYIITPLELRDGKGTVFVNRGWVPKNMRDFSRPQGVVEVVGEVQEPEKRHAFSPINPLRTGQLLWLSGQDLLDHWANPNSDQPGELDIATTQKANMPSQAIILERIAAPGEPPAASTNGKSSSLPSDPAVYPLVRSKSSSAADNCYITPEIHLAYAFTWFSLSLASLIIGYFSFKKNRNMAAKYAATVRKQETDRKQSS